MEKRIILVGFRPYKEKKGKVLFVEKFGFEGVTGHCTDTIFANGDLADLISEETLGRELELHYRKGSNGNFYLVNLEVK